jgi:hypothetical protein
LAEQGGTDDALEGDDVAAALEQIPVVDILT